MKALKLLALCFLFFSATHVGAEELNYNLVQIYANAEENIDNDILVVTMNAEAEAGSAREASNNVNLNMKWALEQSKKITSVKNQTLNYQTRPQYSKKTIISWRASQQLRLESSKIEELSSLIGTLQEKLVVGSMQFSISTGNKNAAIDKLTVQALEAFKTKARLIVKTVEAKDYRLVKINVSENVPHIPYQRNFQAEAMSLSKANAPGVEAGESKINVLVDGTIQLIF